MCAIVGYTGYKPARPILIDALRSVEYRGYDSVGMYLSHSGPHKMVGTVQALADSIDGELRSTTGIAHTRWATHGVPAKKNTHPLCDSTGRVWVVHNGMIENYRELKDELIGKGYDFTSDTDSEVLAHLIGIEYEKGEKPANAVANALTKIIGTYGVAVMFTEHPDTIVIANMGNGLSIGIKDGEYIIASDTAPMLRHTSNVVRLEDGEYAIVTPSEYSIYSFGHKRRSREPKVLDVKLEKTIRSDRPHRMMWDILDLPSVLENSTRGRILMEEGTAKFGGLLDYDKEFEHINRLIIVACGSSYFAGMVGKLLFEDFIGIPVEVEYASEFSNRKILLNGASKDTVLLAISESGETPDVLESVKFAKEVGIRTYGLVNVVGSTISKLVDTGIYNHAGPEVGIRSGKAFISQIEVMALMALYVGRLRGLPKAKGAELIAEIQRLPQKVRSILSARGKIKRIAEEYLGYDDFLFVGRGYNVASAHEGALKLKKASFVHAEGFPAGEVKHGPIAMLNDIFPTMAIMPSDSVYKSMQKDIEELKTRKGPILAIATEGNKEIEEFVNEVMYIPDTKECLTPILVNVQLQLFAYYTGALRGFNVEPTRRPSGVIFDDDYSE